MQQQYSGVTVWVGLAVLACELCVHVGFVRVLVYTSVVQIDGCVWRVRVQDVLLNDVVLALQYTCCLLHLAYRMS